MRMGVRSLWSCVALSVWALPAWADLPANQTIRWNFRADPADPESAIEMYAVVSLTATEVDGSSVGWTVASVEFFKGEGENLKTWIELAPPLDTPDGLWWANHTDPMNPELNEFLDTPVLYGRAYADNPGEADLLYQMESATVGTEGPYEQTSGVDYVLAAADTNEPVKEGTQEPVETEATRRVE